MLPTQLLFFRTKSVAHAFVVPALCKLRKGRGTLGPVSAGNQKPGPPARFYRLSGQSLENLPGLPGDGGYFLHARFLKFHHPITGEQINLEAALPSGFAVHP